MTLPKITKESASLYKLDFDEHCKVEIGDGVSPTLYPQVTFKKWGDECWLRLKPRIPYVNKDAVEIGVAGIEKLTVASDDAKEEQHIYPIEGDAKDDGCLELEAVLFEKPLSGPFTYQWDFEDSGNLEYLWLNAPDLPIPKQQDPYTVPADNEQGFRVVTPAPPKVVSRDINGAYDKDGIQIEFYPEDVVYGYAVYRVGTPKILTAETEHLKTGKVLQIKRPKLIDADGKWEWATINIDEQAGTITVTGTEAWAKTATLPVRVDPNVGYSTQGSFSGTVNNDIFGKIDSPAGNYIASSMRLYIGSWSSGEKVKAAFYDRSVDGLVEGETEERSSGGSGQEDFHWYDASVPSPALNSAETYMMSFWSDSNVTYYYDTGTGTQSGYENDIAGGYGKWPRNPTITTDTYRYSTWVYAYACNIATFGNNTRSYGRHYPGKQVTITGSGFGASQGDGEAFFGDAYDKDSVATTDTLIVDSWSDTSITVTIPMSLNNTLGDMYLYVRPNGGTESQRGFPCNIDEAWGKRWADYNDTTVNWCRAMGGNSPDVDGQTLQSVKIYVGANHSSQVRVAVYQGGTLTDPSGATLKEDLGLTTGSGTEQWLTLTSSTNPSLTKDEPTWIVVKGNDNGFSVAYSAESDGQDFQTARGRYVSSVISTDESVSYPSTWPSDGGSFSDFWYGFQLEYAAEPVPEIDTWSDVSGSGWYHPTKTFRITGIGFGASQGTGSVKLGDASTYAGSSTFDTCTIVSWYDTEILVTVPATLTNSFGTLYVYVITDDGEYNSAGKACDVDQEWGMRWGGGYFTNVNWTRAMGGVSPNLDGMTLQTVYLRCYLHTGQVRVALYSGGSLSTGPTGATLLEEWLTTGSVADWLPLTSVSNPTIPKASNLWLCVKGNDNTFQILYWYPSDDYKTDFQQERGYWQSAAVSTDESVAWPSTWPSDGSGAFDSDDRISIYLAFSIGEEEELSGSIDAESSISGDMESTVPLAGVVAATSLISGDMLKLRLMDGSIDAQSSISGDLEATVPLSGTVAAQSSISGDLETTTPLSGQIDAQSDVSGALDVQWALASQIEAQSDISGDLDTTVPLSGIVAAQSTITGALSKSVPLSGQIDARSDLTGDLETVVPLVGDITAQSNIDGLLDVEWALSGQIDAQSDLSGDLTAVVPLSGQIDSVSTVDGSLDRQPPLSGQIDGQSDISGDLVTPTPLSGQIDAVSDLSGDLVTTVPLSGSVNAISTVDGDLSASVPLSGQIDGVSSIDGDMTTDILLDGSIDAVSLITGDLVCNVPLTGQIDAQSNITGDMETPTPLSGRIEAVSTVVGDMVADVPLAGLIEAQSNITGDMEAPVELSGRIDTVSTILGRLIVAPTSPTLEQQTGYLMVPTGGGVGGFLVDKTGG